MFGVLDKPYLNLDPFLDLSSLPEIEAEITANHRPELETDVYYFPSNLYYKSGKLMEEFYQTKPEALQWKDGIGSNPKIYVGREIALRSTDMYYFKHLASRSNWNDAAYCFPKLMSFIDSLPFSEYGRATVFLNQAGEAGLVHCDDSARTPHRTQFIWIRMNDKRFFIIDEETNQKVYIESQAAFFNTRDYHGSDPHSGICFSLRVDGVFTKEFEKQLGTWDFMSW